VLSLLFRRLFLEALEAAHAAGQLQFFGKMQELREPTAFARYLAPLKKKKWVVYAKAPCAGPQHVLEYLGRYTHRVAISNRRLLALEDGQVSFAWKDYRDKQCGHSGLLSRFDAHPREEGGAGVFDCAAGPQGLNGDQNSDTAPGA